jgi:O-antigen ligase
MGNIHFWAADYIPRQFAYFMTNSVFVAKAGFLRILSELGILGLLLFLAAFGYAGWKLYKINRIRPSAVQGIVLGFLFLALIDYFVTSDASPYYIFALMLTSLCNHIQENAIHAVGN